MHLDEVSPIPLVPLCALALALDDITMFHGESAKLVLFVSSAFEGFSLTSFGSILGLCPFAAAAFSAGGIPLVDDPNRYHGGHPP